MNYKSWLDMAVQKLKLHNDDSVRLDSVLLLEKVTKQDRAYIYAHPEIKLSAQEVTLLDKLLKRRVVGEPMAYILGNKEFYGREFTVTKDVLIPRPDSENIIELLKLNTAIDTSFKLLDVGTGSGCLAITAKLERPNINVYACDISNNALKVAKENAKTLEADITFNESDLFANTPGKFDIILANLPYIPNEFDVSDDVKSEPALALYSGNDGLYLTTKFFEHVIGKLNAGGFIIMESLQIQHKKINQLAEAAGLKLIETKDLVQLYKLK